MSSINSSGSVADRFDRFLDKIDEDVSDYLADVEDDHDPVHNMSGLFKWLSKVRKDLRDRKNNSSVSSSGSIQSETLRVHQVQNGVINGNQASASVLPHQITQDAPQRAEETCSSSSVENSIDVMMSELDKSIKNEEDRGNGLLGDVFDDDVGGFGDAGGAEPMDVTAVAMHFAADNFTTEEPFAQDHVEEERSAQQVKTEAEDKAAEWDRNRMALQEAVIQYGNINALEEHVQKFINVVQVDDAMVELRGVVEWSKKQRRSYKRHELSGEQVQKLEELCENNYWSWVAAPARQNQAQAPVENSDAEDRRIEQLLRNQASRAQDPPARRTASPISAAERKRITQQSNKERHAAKAADKKAKRMRSVKAHDEEWNKYYNLVKKHGGLNRDGRIWDLPADFVVDMRGEKIQLGIWLSVQKMEMSNYEIESPNWYNKLALLFEQGWDISRPYSPAVTLDVPKNEPLSDDESDLESVSVAPSASSSVPSTRPNAVRPSTPNSVVSTGTAASHGTSVTGRTAGTSRMMMTGSTDATVPAAKVSVTKVPPKPTASAAASTAATAKPVDHVLLNQNHQIHQKHSQSQSRQQNQIFAAAAAAEAEAAAGSKRKQPSPEPETNHKIPRSEANPSPHKIKTEPTTSSGSSSINKAVNKASSRIHAIDLSHSASDTDSGSSSSGSASSSASSSSSDYSSSTSSSVRSVDSQDPAVLSSFSLKDKKLFKQQSASGPRPSSVSAGSGSAFAAPAPRPKQSAKPAKASSARRPSDGDMEVILPPRIPDVPADAGAGAPPAANKADVSRDPRLKSTARSHNHVPHTTLPAPVPSPVKLKSRAESPRNPSPSATHVKIKSSPSSADARNLPAGSRPSSTVPRAASKPDVPVKVSPAPSPAPSPTVPSPVPPPRLRGPLVAEGSYVAVVYANAKDIESSTEDAMGAYRFALAKQVDCPPGADPALLHVLRLVPEHPSDLFNSRFKYKHNAMKIVPTDPEKLLIADLQFLVDVPGGDFPLRLTDRSKNDLAVLCESIDVQQICYESE